MKHNKKVTNRKPESQAEEVQEAAMEKRLANPASEPIVPDVLKTEGVNAENSEYVSRSGPDSKTMNTAQSKNDKKKNKNKEKTGKEQEDHDPARAAFE